MRPIEPARSIVEAGDRFMRARQEPRHDAHSWLRIWMCWYVLRGLLEGREPHDIEDSFFRDTTLMQAAAWVDGLRPPQTFHDAAARIRRQRRERRSA